MNSWSLVVRSSATAAGLWASLSGGIGGGGGNGAVVTVLSFFLSFFLCDRNCPFFLCDCPSIKQRYCLVGCAVVV